MPIIKNDSTPNSKTVTGIDLGPSLKNDSTGIMIGKKVEKKYWIVSNLRGHRINDDQNLLNPNTLLANIILDSNPVVVDAPLELKSTKDWERILIECNLLTNNMKPSFTYAILSHAWRAAELKHNLPTDVCLYEIFPASWFWLCEFDEEIEWKGNNSANVRDRKILWFTNVLAILFANFGLTIQLNIDSILSSDEADALPCVLCAILSAEGFSLPRLGQTDPRVLFPLKELWDLGRLPPEILNMPWLF